MAEEKIIKGNIDFYKNLLEKVEATKAPDAQKDMVRYIANIQLNKLYNYLFNDAFFVVEEEKTEAVDEKVSVESAAE